MTSRLTPKDIIIAAFISIGLCLQLTVVLIRGFLTEETTDEERGGVS